MIICFYDQKKKKFPQSFHAAVGPQLPGFAAPYPPNPLPCSVRPAQQLPGTRLALETAPGPPRNLWMPHGPTRGPNVQPLHLSVVTKGGFSQGFPAPVAFQRLVQLLCP